MRTSFIRLSKLGCMIAAFVYLGGDVRAFAASPPPPICDEVCTSSADCTDVCYLNMLEFENGNDITCLDYGVYDADYCCGDGLCNLAGTESMGNCAADCGAGVLAPTCGSSGCEQGENCNNCAQDCGGCDYSSTCDGDRKCEDGETSSCRDCMSTGYCTQNSDCPDFQGGSFTYFCVEDQCVLEDLPNVTSTCTHDSQCPSGWKCIDIPPNYHGSSYSCTGSGCKVCVPRWINPT